MLACDVMTPRPPTVAATLPAAECRQLLRQEAHRVLPVVDGWEHPLGIVTALRAFAGQPTFATAADLLEHGIRAHPHDPLGGVLRRWIGARSEAVLVTDGLRVLGVLTEHDACRIGAAVLPDVSRVGDYATAEVLRASPDEPAARALARMHAHRVRHLVVADAADRPVGVLSLRDLLRRRADERDDLVVCDALGGEVTWTAAALEPMSVAAARMVTLGVGCLPVLSPSGRILGVVTRVDVLRALLDADLFEDDPQVARTPQSAT